MTTDEIQQLKLKSKIPKGSKFSLNCKINLSDKFYAIVISYQLSEETLNTTLITYDKDYNVIDMLNIAYDEIVESWYRVESTIYDDKIIVENILYLDKVPKVDKIYYSIKPNGIFEQKNNTK